MANLIIDVSVLTAALLLDEPYNQAAREVLQRSLQDNLVTSSLLCHEEGGELDVGKG